MNPPHTQRRPGRPMPGAVAATARLRVLGRTGAVVTTARLAAEARDRHDVDASLLYGQNCADTYGDIFGDPRQWFENHSQYLDQVGWEYLSGNAKWDRPAGPLEVDQIIRQRFAAIPGSAPQMHNLVDRALARLGQARTSGNPALARFGTAPSGARRGCFYLTHVDHQANGPVFHMVNFWYDTQEHVTNGLFHTIREATTVVSTSYGIRRLDRREYATQRQRVEQALAANAEQGLQDLQI
ncbi:hypothetical protein [Actinomadura rudentiformis]|uniref:Uncharacterized protein n=1 Tax=Actinomadura rudentiformis TaxID=359158 RepID=A0A6H9YTT3_9ACTN|nr:hypothetical protein [Actinomadura rudentiformis]KAB2346904.1 hypothetical protein F8566_22165 [Actinomadura rudentiformis]